MKRVFLLAAVLLGPLAHAGDAYVDEVLNALERKGLLSAQDVHDIKLKAREAERAQAAADPHPETDFSQPDWVLCFGLITHKQYFLVTSQSYGFIDRMRNHAGPFDGFFQTGNKISSSLLNAPQPGEINVSPVNNINSVGFNLYLRDGFNISHFAIGYG